VTHFPAPTVATRLVAALAIAAGVVTLHAQSRAQSAPAPAAAATAATLPDVVGIRTGITAQAAYDLLKARSAGGKIGIGQFPVAGVTDKPVPNSMSVELPNSNPHETLTVWLTTPPSEQVVWAVGRRLQIDPAKPLLTSTVVAGLKQKYGAEAAYEYFWEYDAQGRQQPPARMLAANCVNIGKWNLPIVAPTGATYDYVTPLLMAPAPRTACDSLVEVIARIQTLQDRTYTVLVEVTISDLDLAHRSQEARMAFIANGNATQNKEELDKARQRNAPAF